MNIHWLVILFMTALSLYAACSQERRRRVINGVPLNGRPTTYTAIRYYAAMATRHGVAWYDFLWDGRYGASFCSGSLLTPIIFQTACHCVAIFNARATKQFIKRPTVKNHWEDNGVVYPGVSNRFGENSMVTYSYISIEKYIVHPKCGRLGGSRVTTHDFGLVRLLSDWIKADCHTPYPWIEIEWAPQYTSKAILNFHAYAIQEQLVCLFVGFGAYSQGNDVSSDVLRHGWAVLIPRTTCVRETTIIKGLPADFNQRDVTWACTNAFPQHATQSGSGDSGGPVTCNNHYFGIVSGRTIRRVSKTRKILSYVTRVQALIHTLFTNAIEYRQSLINVIYRLPRSYPDPKGSLRALPNNFKKFLRFSLHDSEFPPLLSQKSKLGYSRLVLVSCVCFTMKKKLVYFLMYK